MNIIIKAAQAYSNKARSHRAERFRSFFDISNGTKILDLGSETGSAIHSVLQGTRAQASNIYIADIERDRVEQGSRLFGYQPVVIPESGRLPFEDKFFDIVYCSSVIEHVTIPKEEVWELKSGKEFSRRSLASQLAFAQEIRRIGKQYYVQCPHKHFPIESHSWLPFLSWTPRPILIPLLKITNRIWPKSTQPDWNLLTNTDMQLLFPDAKIFAEESFGFTKSLMAVRKL